MTHNKIKSYAKINLALNVTGKTSKLHKIESIVGFVSLYDLIIVKKVKAAKNIIKMGENPDNVHNFGCPSGDYILSSSFYNLH